MTVIPDLLYKLACAIATAEGFFVNGALPQRDNNPGDLRAAPWLQHPAIVNDFWKADSLDEGIAGLEHQLALDVARGWTARTFVYTYAPPGDGNKSENYLSELCRRTGIQYFPLVNGEADPKEVPMWSYLSIQEIA